MRAQNQTVTGARIAGRTADEEIAYQIEMINRILTVWYEIENAEPIFG